jgi:hypothetical protein
MVVLSPNKFNRSPSGKLKQKGVVLIVALVFLIALTAVAAALMQNTTTDIKMAGASQEKSITVQETISEMDRVIYNEVNRVNLNAGGDPVNRFTLPADSFTVPVVVNNLTLPAITTGSIDIANEYKLETDCPHNRAGSSAEVFTCNVMRVMVNRTYGRNNNSAVQVNAGIAQELPKNGG